MNCDFLTAKFPPVIPISQTYYGKVRLTGSPEHIVNQMYNNEAIQFEINFPTQDPLPTVSSILVNGNSICSDQCEWTRTARHPLHS